MERLGFVLCEEIEREIERERGRRTNERQRQRQTEKDKERASEGFRPASAPQDERSGRQVDERRERIRQAAASPRP